MYFFAFVKASSFKYDFAKNINDKKYVRKVLKLRFLPKDIQESILNGTQDVTMSLKGLFA